MKRFKTPRVIFIVLTIALSLGALSWFVFAKSSHSSAANTKDSVAKVNEDNNSTKRQPEITTTPNTTISETPAQKASVTSIAPQKKVTPTSSNLDKDMKDLDSSVKKVDDSQNDIDNGFNDKSIDLNN